MSTQPRTPARWRSTLLAPTALACVASAGLAAEAPGREPASALQAEPDGDSAEQPDPGFEAPTTGATEPESEEPDGEGEEPEGEEEEGDVGGLEWFMAQRAYPNGIPVGAYARAKQAALAIPVVKVGASERLEVTADVPGNAELVTVPARSAKKAPSVPGAPTTSLASTSGAAVLPAVAGGLSWVPLGPRSISSQQAASDFRQYSGGPPYSGRVTAIATHPTNSAVAWLGGAVGGVWRTVDSGATWTPVFDAQASLSIGSIAVDRTTPSIVYVGTGEENSVAAQTPNGVGTSYYGTGIYKSTTSGTSWTRVGGTTFGSCHVGAILTHPTVSGTVVAAVSGAGVVGASGCNPGIWRSTDGGLTWSKRFSSYTGGYEYPVHSLAVSPGAPNTMYAGVSYWGVFRSLDGGASWTRVTSGLPTTDVARIQVTVAPTDPNRVYAAIAAVNGNVRGLYTSANAGTTWTLIAPTATAAAWNCNTQCWYDLTVAASPTTADNVYVGGVTITKYTGNGLSSAVVLNPQTGGGVGVHWDIHVLTFDAAKRLWIGTDGGVYRWDDQSQPAVNLNKTLGLTQFYPGISGSTGGYLVGGAQDMASNATTGALGWNNVPAGDGGYTVIDRSTSPPTYLVTSQYFSLGWSSTGTAYTFGSSGIDPNETRPFITPMVAGTGSPLRIYAGLRRVYLSTSHGSTWAPISPVLRTTATISALAQAPSNQAVVWAGGDDGGVHRTLNGTAATPTWVSVNTSTSPIPYRHITDIAIDPTTPRPCGSPSVASTAVASGMSVTSSAPSTRDRPGRMSRRTCRTPRQRGGDPPGGHRTAGLRRHRCRGLCDRRQRDDVVPLSDRSAQRPGDRPHLRRSEPGHRSHLGSGDVHRLRRRGHDIQHLRLVGGDLGRHRLDDVELSLRRTRGRRASVTLPRRQPRRCDNLGPMDGAEDWGGDLEHGRVGV